MMAKCYECGESLSSEASTCGHCGYYYSHVGVTRGTNVRRPNGDYGAAEWAEDNRERAAKDWASGKTLVILLSYVAVIAFLLWMSWKWIGGPIYYVLWMFWKWIEA